MNYAAFAAVVLVWGSSWIATKLQLGIVPVEQSIFWRSLVAGAVLAGFSALRGARWPRGLGFHALLAFQGAAMFGLNNLGTYHAVGLMPSGLVAIAFCLVVPLNALGQRLFFAVPLSPRVLAGGAAGMAGLILIFWPQIIAADGTSAALGLGLSLLAAGAVSAGNLAALKHSRGGSDLIACTGIALIYGSLSCLAVVLASGADWAFDLSWRYGLSFVWLALLGTAVVFCLYLWLIARMGADRAALVTIIYPIVALSISTVWEDYHWSTLSLAGVLVAVCGNLYALSRRAPAKRAAVRARHEIHAVKLIDARAAAANR